MDKVFSYGTLKDRPVQHTLLGRFVRGIADALVGYTTELIEIEEKQFLRAIPSADKKLSGKCLEVSKAELQKIDIYEGKEYIRVKKILQSGSSAWVYVRPE